jgi:hypothetical protein
MELQVLQVLQGQTVHLVLSVRKVHKEFKVPQVRVLALHSLRFQSVIQIAH